MSDYKCPNHNQGQGDHCPCAYPNGGKCCFCGKSVKTGDVLKFKPSFVSYALTLVSMDELSMMDKSAKGVPTHVAIAPDGTAYVWPSPSGDLKDLKPPKKRRWVVEFKGHQNLTGAGFDGCSGDIIREVKPFTWDQVEETVKPVSTELKHDTCKIIMVLRALGIEVED